MTVRVNAWVAFGKTPFEAVMVTGNEPDWVGLPESTPVLENVTPVGRGPDSLKVDAGYPVAVTVKLSAVTSVNVALFAEVIAGAWSTVSVKDWEAFGLTPLDALIVNA